MSIPFISLSFTLICLTRRNDSNRLTVPDAMTYDQQMRMNTRPEKYESILYLRMVRIGYKPSELIRKSSFSLEKRDVMLLAISGILARIP